MIASRGTADSALSFSGELPADDGKINKISHTAKNNYITMTAFLKTSPMRFFILVLA